MMKMFLSSVLFVLVTVVSCAEEFKSQIMFNGYFITCTCDIKNINRFHRGICNLGAKTDPEFAAKNIAIYVSAGGSGAGVKSVIEGMSDFGMVARLVKDSEKAKIKDYHEYVVASDALTVSVNNENPILKYQKEISTETLRKIFSGEYKYWSDVDNRLEKKEIVVVTRDLGGGAHEVFQKAVMKDAEVKDDAIQAPSMEHLLQKLLKINML